MAETHKEKDELIKSLKQKIKDLELAVKVATSTEQSMNNVGLSVVREGQNYIIVTMRFNEDGLGKVVERRNVGRDYSIALFQAKKFLVEDILLKIMG